MKNIALKPLLFTLILVSALVFTACGDDDDNGGEPGQIELTVYGEEFIEDGIPADEFVDGWALTFDKFLVVVGNVEVTGDGTVSEPTFRVFDVAASSGGSGHTLAQLAADGGNYTALQYQIAPATDAVAGNAAQADVDMMNSSGNSVHVIGSATKDNQTISFDWAFSTSVIYSPCEVDLPVDANTAPVEITIHGDHLFFDDLVSDEPNVAFDIVAAADADMDGTVTMAELSAMDITGETRYQVGSADITDLGAFIEAQVRLVGHINGEGHCDTQ